MSAFKCKMCGGTLEIQHGDTVAECEYCGTKQTLPKLDDEKRVNLYDRANHFRRNNDFDKASAIYEQILNEDGTDAEAYWSLVLCRYGIEYVEDPTSHKRVPTVHRAQYTSIFDDDNYKMALENADTYQKIIYDEEAKAINEIQKGILAISQKEEPFDVFICYKETDSGGNRTHDSVLAQDLYYELSEQGFKVFFARITLEDKLGSAYEPYIFAALNSAKVMVVVGTKPEFFNAVWVKNEWSRYLSLIKNGAKKTLIPAYRDMDPYDLPQEFSHLQAQDMSKLGFMQDLIRGINKIAEIEKNQVKSMRESTVTATKYSNPLLERAFIFIEDGDFESGDEYLEKVLDSDPRCAEAYLGKLMIDMKAKKRTDLERESEPFNNNVNYIRAVRFGSSELVEEINGYLQAVESAKQVKEEMLQLEQAQKEAQQAQSEEELAKKENERIAQIIAKYKSIPSEAQIEKSVKDSESIKKSRKLAIIFLILYFPVGIILWLDLKSKIKKAVVQEQAKYNQIRLEYKKIAHHQISKSTTGKGKTFKLEVINKDNTAINQISTVTMRIGSQTFPLSGKNCTTLSLAPGKHRIEFSDMLRKKMLSVEMCSDMSIVLSRKNMFAPLDIEVINK